MSNFKALILFLTFCIGMLYLNANIKKDYYVCQNKVTKAFSHPLNKREFELILKTLGQEYLENNTCEKKELKKEDAYMIKRIIKNDSYR